MLFTEDKMSEAMTTEQREELERRLKELEASKKYLPTPVEQQEADRQIRIIRYRLGPAERMNAFVRLVNNVKERAARLRSQS